MQVAHLPEHDAERPYVGLGRAEPLEEALRGHPEDGQAALANLPVVVRRVQVPGDKEGGSDHRGHIS